MNRKRQPQGTPIGGQFATDERGLPSHDTEDVLATEDCPLCHTPVDYCMGHGKWNSSEWASPRDVQLGDEVWNDETASAVRVVGITEIDGGWHFRGLRGAELRVGHNNEVLLLPNEPVEEDFGDHDQSIRVCHNGPDCDCGGFHAANLEEPDFDAPPETPFSVEDAPYAEMSTEERNAALQR